MLRRISAFALVPFALLLETTEVGATSAQRTFVAPTGNDANICSLVAPCRSFTRALAQTSPKGEIVVLDSAGYGHVTIAQSVSIVAPTGIYAGISVSAGEGVTIDAGVADTVVLRGLVINGQGGSIGINFVQGSLVRLENCIVSNWTSKGIQHIAAGGKLVVLDSIVGDNGGTGILMQADGDLLLDGVHVEHNAGDGASATAVAGLASAHIRNSNLSYNGAAGVAAFNPAPPSARTSVDIEASMLTGNSGDGVFAGGVAAGSTDVTLARSTVSGNQLSGVSVFQSAARGGVSAELTGNTFADNVSVAVKVDGNTAGGSISQNAFNGVYSTFLVQNGGELFTFGDNSGSPSTLGGTPTPAPRF